MLTPFLRKSVKGTIVTILTRNYLKISSSIYAVLIISAFILVQVKGDNNGYFDFFVALTLGYIAILQHVVLKEMNKSNKRHND